MITTIQDKGSALSCAELDENFKSSISLATNENVFKRVSVIVSPNASFTLFAHTELTQNKYYHVEGYATFELEIGHFVGTVMYDGTDMYGSIAYTKKVGSTALSVDVDWNTTIATFGASDDVHVTCLISSL